jgi:hypothetical protein
MEGQQSRRERERERWVHLQRAKQIASRLPITGI